MTTQHANENDRRDEIKRELLQAYVSGEQGNDFPISESADRILALSAREAPPVVVIPASVMDALRRLRAHARNTGTRGDSHHHAVINSADSAIAWLATQPPAEQRQEAFDDWSDEALTNGVGHAPADTYKACREAFDSAWPQGKAAAEASAQATFYKLHPRKKPAAPASGDGLYDPTEDDVMFGWRLAQSKVTRQDAERVARDVARKRKATTPPAPAGAVLDEVFREGAAMKLLRDYALPRDGGHSKEWMRAWDRRVDLLCGYHFPAEQEQAALAQPAQSGQGDGPQPVGGGAQAIGAAFLSVLADPHCKWRDTGARPFIDRVAHEVAINGGRNA